jgi:hypothetical protein
VIGKSGSVPRVRSLKSANAGNLQTYREHDSTTVEVVSTGVAIAVTQSVWPTSTPRYLRVSDIAALFGLGRCTQAGSTQAWKRTASRPTRRLFATFFHLVFSSISWRRSHDVISTCGTHVACGAGCPRTGRAEAVHRQAAAFCSATRNILDTVVNYLRTANRIVPMFWHGGVVHLCSQAINENQIPPTLPTIDRELIFPALLFWGHQQLVSTMETFSKLCLLAAPRRHQRHMQGTSQMLFTARRSVMV